MSVLFFHQSFNYNLEEGISLETNKSDQRLSNTFRKPIGYIIYSIGERVADEDADTPDDESYPDSNGI